MFFVFIGILILFASFIIALLSLIREQSQRDISSIGQMVPEVQPEPVSKEEVEVSSEVVQEESLVAETGTGGEPFPWEMVSSEFGSEVRIEQSVDQSAGTITRSREDLSGEIYIRRKVE